MNKLFKIAFLSLLIVICNLSSAQSISSELTSVNKTNNALELTVVTVNNKTILQVSFKGKEPIMIAHVQIKNSSNEVVQEISEVDVKSSPAFFTVDISNYQIGSYSISLNIEGKITTSTFTIK